MGLCMKWTVENKKPYFEARRSHFYSLFTGSVLARDLFRFVRFVTSKYGVTTSHFLVQRKIHCHLISLTKFAHLMKEQPPS